MASTTFCLRLDPDLKHESEVLFDELGLTLTSAINIFLKQAVRVGGMPFDLRLDTNSLSRVDALLEADSLTGSDNGSFPSIEDVLAELGHE